ncbi:C4-dicarboxylate ABC transporter permease [Sulfitobacter sp. EhC04]|uniref:TRAP transporter small permease n=1 Tax=Sulfitobacter sp. EhC04 TaxID=1849168 RepID=UPI0007F46F78|nr:TRAP transporter small permease subunit [Sulfitobacter sp. EhC04]OAN75653.1 C4-dicarboxylate ABC transporter permease [Sulfitobacter sp. EhC04]
MPSFTRLKQVARVLADAVPAILLAAMFLCFIIQVLMRYVMNTPVGWTVEVCVIAWLWILLWGQSVSAREEDEIRFDILYGSVSPAVRRWFRMVFSVFLVGIYAWSLPALWDFVTFMKIQKTSYLDIRFNWVYAIALVFSVVSIIRYLWVFWTAAQGHDAPEAGADAVVRKDLVE